LKRLVPASIAHRAVPENNMEVSSDCSQPTNRIQHSKQLDYRKNELHVPIKKGNKIQHAVVSSGLHVPVSFQNFINIVSSLNP